MGKGARLLIFSISINQIFYQQPCFFFKMEVIHVYWPMMPFFKVEVFTSLSIVNSMLMVNMIHLFV